jgi:hypothetical protein
VDDDLATHGQQVERPDHVHRRVTHPNASV